MTITSQALKARFPNLLSKFSASELDTLLAALMLVQVAPGETLYRNGDHCDTMYLLWQGKLSLSLVLEEQEITLGDIGPGGFVGVLGVIDPGPALLTVKSSEASELLSLEHSGLVALRSTHPRLASNLLRALSLDLVEWLRDYEEYMAKRMNFDNIKDFLRIGRFEHFVS